MSSLWPDRNAVVPDRHVRRRRRCSAASSTPVPRSPCARLAETTATRSWPMRRISAGPIASVTSATAVSGTGTSLPGLTIRLRTSSIDAARVSTLRTSTSIFLSTQRVARGDFAAHAVARPGRRCRAPTRPSCVARSWSNTIWISGLPASTVDLTSAKRGVGLHAQRAPARRRRADGRGRSPRPRPRAASRGEQARAAELVLHARQTARSGPAHAGHRALLRRRDPTPCTERDAEPAGVLAGVDRVRVEAVARAGDGVGEGDVRRAPSLARCARDDGAVGLPRAACPAAAAGRR